MLGYEGLMNSQGRKYDGLAVLSLIIESMTPKQSPHEVSPRFKTP